MIKKYMFIISVIIFAFAISACTFEEEKKNASDTPIGSVLSGETKNTDAYLEKVKQRNNQEKPNVFNQSDKW